MNLYSPELMYEFYIDNAMQTTSLKQYCDHAVKEIKLAYGWDTEVQIDIKPDIKDKDLFLVSMVVYGLGEAIVASKEGKHIMSVLKKVKKSVMKKIHRLSEHKTSYRKKISFKEQQAS